MPRWPSVSVYLLDVKPKDLALSINRALHGWFRAPLVRVHEFLDVCTSLAAKGNWASLPSIRMLSTETTFRFRVLAALLWETRFGVS